MPCAGASDGGGSIRIPAACCGLFGLKGSRGLVPHGPLYGEGLNGSATDGVVSRTVRDSARMLDAIAGPAPESPYLIEKSATPYADELGQPSGKLKIAYFTETAINPNPDAEAVKAVDDAAALLESLGHEVTELPKAPFDDAQLAEDFLIGWFAYCAWGVAEAKEYAGARNRDFENDTLIMAALGRGAGAVAFCSAVERKQDHVRALAAFHEQYDLLLTPSLATPPPTIGAVRAARRTACHRGRAAEAARRWAAAPHVDRHRHDREEPRLGAVHAAGQHHRPPGDERAAALDGGRAAAGRAVRRQTRVRGAAAAAGSGAGTGAAVGR